MKIFGSIFLLLCLLLAVSCSKSPEKKKFEDWYSVEKTGNFDLSKLKSKELFSKAFDIDTIYRSMKGPIDQEIFYLADSGDVVWLTGYKVEVLNSNGNVIESGFMCHNNLNLDSIRRFPWQPQNFDYSNRVFTLTQGITELALPQGYAVPVPGEQGLKAMYQALNHNYENIDTVIQHRITINYFVDSEIDFKLKPVFMQTLWMVKQYEGPIGKMGEKPEENEKFVESIDNENYHPAQQPSCGVDMLANNEALKGVDMYYDSYGRKYTGHWKIPYGKEEIEMNIDKMLNLDQRRKVVMAVAHVHPFCTELSLKSNEEKIISLKMQQSDKGIGLNEIQVIVPDEETFLSPKSHYSLNSVYHNTSSDTLSAMSVMYLYLEE